jgi:hypothetical protein
VQPHTVKGISNEMVQLWGLGSRGRGRGTLDMRMSTGTCKPEGELAILMSATLGHLEVKTWYIEGEPSREGLVDPQSVKIGRSRGIHGHAHGAPIVPLGLRGRGVEEVLELSSHKSRDQVIGILDRF